MSYKEGDRFIIEIEEVYKSDLVSPDLYRVKGFNSLVFDEYGLNRLVKVSEVPQPILTDEEYDYLETLIKPCKESIRHIVRTDFDGDNECIRVCLPTVACDLLPFPNGDRYRGLAKGRLYTLEELGL